MAGFEQRKDFKVEQYGYPIQNAFDPVGHSIISLVKISDCSAELQASANISRTQRIYSNFR